MSWLKYFFNKTRFITFIIPFIVSLIFMGLLFISFHKIYNEKINDYKQEYFTEIAYQMAFMFRNGYTDDVHLQAENKELFKKKHSTNIFYATVNSLCFIALAQGYNTFW